MKHIRHSLILMGVFLLISLPANAVTITAFGGSYLGSGESGLLGGEVTVAVSRSLHLGGCYEYSQGTTFVNLNGTLTGTGSYSRNNLSAVGRYKIPLLDFFGDARFGLMFPQSTDLLNGLNAQLGLGYSFLIVPNMLEIQPRLGVLLFALGGASYPALNASLMASLNL